MATQIGQSVCPDTRRMLVSYMPSVVTRKHAATLFEFDRVFDPPVISKISSQFSAVSSQPIEFLLHAQ